MLVYIQCHRPNIRKSFHLLFYILLSQCWIQNVFAYPCVLITGVDDISLLSSELVSEILYSLRLKDLTCS